MTAARQFGFSSPLRDEVASDAGAERAGKWCAGSFSDRLVERRRLRFLAPSALNVVVHERLLPTGDIVHHRYRRSSEGTRLVMVNRQHRRLR